MLDVVQNAAGWIIRFAARQSQFAARMEGGASFPGSSVAMGARQPALPRLVPFHRPWYHDYMALNIKDPETERLAAEVAALTGKTKTGAVRYALRQMLESLSRPTVRQREEHLNRFLEEEIWPLVPPGQLGHPVSKAEREQILGFGEDGV
jgi:antitoxin VapB